MKLVKDPFNKGAPEPGSNEFFGINSAPPSLDLLNPRVTGMSALHALFLQNIGFAGFGVFHRTRSSHVSVAVFRDFERQGIFEI